jgi:hypothetical protein
MRFINAVTILAVFMVAACSSKESRSHGTAAVAPLLVGHWSTHGNDALYYGGIDAASKTGSFIMVHPDGKAFTHRYEIESENPGDRTVKVNLLFASGDSREETVVVSEDGKTLEVTTEITGIEVNSELTKVDDKTAP